ncbi:copper transporter [Saccharopolyspora erythraea]|uniref:copper transporter n=1 Tax=Saccharopolyspora erythraea TaxID=1836 RepID=UPI001BAAE82A|nr:copper transporter [Saccharopolyspora erythraea]QUH04330.1 copper transporter [Saccharopolyspora erythraea]
MISLRYHIVSVAAVFLALALGVVLGSTSVSERLLSSVVTDRDSLNGQAAQLRAERDALRAQIEGADRFGRAIGPAAVRGQLNGRTVVLISDHRVDPADRDALKELLSAAGATVTGELQLTDGVTDPYRADQLRQVVTELLPTGVQVPASADPGTLAGGLLGPVSLLDPRSGQPHASGEERTAALAGLTAGGFAHVVQDVKPAQAAVVLTRARVEDESAGARSAILARLATQLDRSGSGAVLAGTAGSADGSGPVGIVRADNSIASLVSTVDNTETAAGRVAVIMALREQFDRQSGHYGSAGNAQGPLPGSRG